MFCRQPSKYEKKEDHVSLSFAIIKKHRRSAGESQETKKAHRLLGILESLCCKSNLLQVESLTVKLIPLTFIPADQEYTNSNPSPHN
jgi:hypothetical protein